MRSFGSLKRAAEKIQFFRELIGRALGRAFSEKLRGDAGESGEIGGLGFGAAVDQNSEADQGDAGAGHQIERDAVGQGLAREGREAHFGWQRCASQNQD